MIVRKEVTLKSISIYHPESLINQCSSERMEQHNSNFGQLFMTANANHIIFQISLNLDYHLMFFCAIIYQESNAISENVAIL